MKLSVKCIICILFVCLGIHMIFLGTQNYNNLPLYKKYNTFQEITYKEAYYVNKVFRSEKGKSVPKEDMSKINLYLCKLNSQRDSLYADILNFPSSLSSIKEHSAKIYDQSVIVYSHFESNFRNLKKEDNPCAEYFAVLKEAIDYTYEYSIRPTKIRREIEGVTWFDDFLKYW